MKDKIAIIIPYFGKFPIWIDLYLYSCSKNSFIDFIFYTDCEIPMKVYSNTIFHRISFTDYCGLISKRLGINFKPERPYKLCDMKPFYGIIHKEELHDYKYWGFGDLDLVYGDLSKVVNEKKLRRYLLITTHADRIAGHLTIIKKDSYVTNLCLKIAQWKKKLECNTIEGLDETDMTRLVFPENRYFLKIYSLLKKYLCPNLHLYDFFAVPNFFRNLFSNVFKKEYYTSELPKKGQVWTYNLATGEIVNYRNKEIPYLHFLFFKKTPFWNTDIYWKDNYWQVPHLDFTNSRGIITFTNEKVVYKDINI